MIRALIIILLLAGCTTQRPCDAGTVAVSVTLNGAARAADSLVVAVSIDGSLSNTSTIPLAAPIYTGQFVVDFAAGYPQGRMVTVQVTAMNGATEVGMDRQTGQLSAACESLSLSLGTDTDAGSKPDGGCGVMCGTTCVASLATDVHHCGRCDLDCLALPGASAGAQCIGGVCDLSQGCMPGRAHCSATVTDGCETDVTVPAHCGSCASTCSGTTPLCSIDNAGTEYSCVAACSGGTTQCGQSCIDTSKDANHCGSCAACAVPIDAVATCMSGTCGATCKSGYHACSGACADNTSIHSCGASCDDCAPPTNADATCDGTSCGFTCKPGYTPMGGGCGAHDYWSAVAPIPTGRLYGAAATGADGRIYVLGGQNAGGVTIATVEAYTPSTDSWATMAPMPTARLYLAAAAGSDGRIYAIGGAKGTTVYATVEVYTPSTNSWATAAPLSAPRYQLAAATGADGRIYAIGGADSNANVVATVEAYTAATNTWATAPAMLTGVSYPAAAAGKDGRIYFFGGESQGGVHSALTSGYTPGASAWTAGKDLPTPRFALAAATGQDGRIYVLGGSSLVSGTLATVEAYDPTTNLWSGVKSMPSARVDLSAAAGLDGRIYVFGGISGGARDVEAYTP